jgi:hypothetical protein
VFDVVQKDERPRGRDAHLQEPIGKVIALGEAGVDVVIGVAPGDVVDVPRRDRRKWLKAVDVTS